MWRRFYHVTQEKNVDSIIDSGLLPCKANGRRKVVWLVDGRRLYWALAHVSSKHSVPVSDLWVCSINIDPRMLVHTSWRGVFTTSFVVLAKDIYPAASMLNRGPMPRKGE